MAIASFYFPLNSFRFDLSLKDFIGMKKILFIAISISLFSCSSSNNKNSKSNTQSTGFETKVELSANTKLFLQELNQERETQKKSDFVPSDELIEKYSLVEQANNYFIRAFLKVETDFDYNELENLEVMTNSKVGEIITVAIPLGAIPAILDVEKIEYLEINQKQNKF